MKQLRRKMGISEEAKNRRRKEILKAATALFVKKGYEGTSFNEIAVKARASKETLYAWFGSKTEILNELLRERGDTLQATIQAEATSGKPEDVLFVIAREVLRQMVNSPALRLMSAALAAAPKHKELRDLVAERLSPAPLAAYLEYCRGMGLMAFDDAQRAAMVFGVMLQGDYPVRLGVGLIKTISEEEIETHARFVTKMFLKATAPVP
jgi:AcrR family transcriptional regulator